MLSAVIPAYPHEGAFFWFLAEERARNYSSDCDSDPWCSKDAAEALT